MSGILKRNGNLSQTSKPIIIERASYCIQFEVGTETVKTLKFNKTSQSSEKIIIGFSECREIESKKKENLEKNWQCLSHLREKSTDFHLIQTKKMDLGCGNSFHLLTADHLLQMTIVRKMFESYIFFRRSVSVP